MPPSGYNYDDVPLSSLPGMGDDEDPPSISVARPSTRSRTRAVDLEEFPLSQDVAPPAPSSSKVRQKKTDVTISSRPPPMSQILVLSDSPVKKGSKAQKGRTVTPPVVATIPNAPAGDYELLSSDDFNKLSTSLYSSAVCLTLFFP